MSKSLIIAEKPSVAQDIVRALTPIAGKFEKHDEYFESEGYVVSSAVGHLVEIKAPEEFDVKRGKWSFAHLPVIPPHFDLNPIDKSKGRLNALVKLIRRKDVIGLINACDAGREGELIFRLIVQYAGTAKAAITKPVQRLWLQSMTPQAIRDGFEALRSDAQMLPLADAARCRSEADWLVGINGTRAMTAFNSRDGGFFLTTVGRVQTPTLSIVVEREEKIRKHVARAYWEVRGTFDAQAGQYEGKWFDPQWTPYESDLERRADRVVGHVRTEVDAIATPPDAAAEASTPAIAVEVFNVRATSSRSAPTSCRNAVISSRSHCVTCSDTAHPLGELRRDRPAKRGDRRLDADVIRLARRRQAPAVDDDFGLGRLHCAASGEPGA